MAAKKLKTLAVASLLLLLSSAAAAQVCGPRYDIIKRLWKRWGEKQVAMGLANDNRLVEVFVSEEGSWTVIISDSNGRSCAASAGRNWTTDGFPEPGKGT